MNGQELFIKYTEVRSEYKQLLMFLHANIGDALFPLLEKAEAEGKQLAYDESKVPESILDGFDESLILLV